MPPVGPPVDGPHGLTALPSDVGEATWKKEKKGF